MIRTVKVPSRFEPLYEIAEKRVADLFREFKHDPQEGRISVGGERYVLVRGESLFSALFDHMERAFGAEQAQELMYNMAWVIGEADCKSFSRTRGVTDPKTKISAGPVHFSYSGWGSVNIFPDSRPSDRENFLLHYGHPNTFESEISRSKELRPSSPVCYFSAGYSAGWCTEAYGLKLHAREIRCTACGHEQCEFIMAPYGKLDEFARERAAEREG